MWFYKCFVSELPWKNFSKKVEIRFKTCWGESGWYNGTGLINVNWVMLLEYLKLHEMTDTALCMYVNIGFHQWSGKFAVFCSHQEKRNLLLTEKKGLYTSVFAQIKQTRRDVSKSFRCAFRRVSGVLLRFLPSSNLWKMKPMYQNLQLL